MLGSIFGSTQSGEGRAFRGGFPMCVNIDNIPTSIVAGIPAAVAVKWEAP